MSFFSIQTKPTARMLRQFAAAWLVFFLLLAANQVWRRGHISLGLVFAVVALAGVAGLFKPHALRVLFIVASAIAFPIGWLVGNLVLVAMFYGVVTPTAWFWKIRGRDVLQLRAKKEQASFWISREAQPPPEQYLKQF